MRSVLRFKQSGAPRCCRVLLTGMPPTGGVAGGVVAADATELATLSTAAGAAQRQVEDVARQAGAIIGALDGRGWNSGAVQVSWSSARGQFTQLGLALAAAASELAERALLVNIFETGNFGAASDGSTEGFSPSDLKNIDDIL